MLFESSVRLPCSVETAFAYHERRGALDRLLPPNEKVKIVKRPESLQIGQRAILSQRIFGISAQWVAEHCSYSPPTLFADQQLSGPFHRWQHQHHFAADGDQCSLRDEVEYVISRFGVLGYLVKRFVKRKISSMFAYRHRVTKADIDLINRLPSSTPKRIAITGASGFLGSRIAALASVLGHQVIAVERVKTADEVKKFNSDPDEQSIFAANIPWHVSSGAIRPTDWQSVDVLIHLAGANIPGKRWTDAYKKVLYESRVDATKKLMHALSSSECLPAVMVTASGGGIYPDSANRLLPETAKPGDDFLGQLAHDWEQASQQYASDKMRWCAGRLAMVLDPQHGALVPLLWQTKLGASGNLGDGKMFWSWIERDDAASAFLWMALNESCTGAYNLTGEPVTNSEFMRTLSHLLLRPNLFAAPDFAVRLGVGEMADGLLLRSNRLDNSKLLRFLTQTAMGYNVIRNH